MINMPLTPLQIEDAAHAILKEFIDSSMTTFEINSLLADLHFHLNRMYSTGLTGVGQIDAEMLVQLNALGDNPKGTDTKDLR